MSSIQASPKKNPHMAYIEQLSERISAKIGRDYFGYSLLIIAALIYPLCFINASRNNFTAVEANMVRGLTIFVTHFFVARFLGISLDFKGVRNNKYLMLRNMIMLVNQIAYTGMHYVVPIPVINILNISGSLFAFVIDYFLYGTKIHKQQIPGIIAGCLGVVVTVNGELIMKMIDPSFSSDKSEFHNYVVQSMGLRILFCSLYILMSMLWGFGCVIQKQIKDVSGLKISYHSGIVFAFATALVYPVAVSDPISQVGFLEGCAYQGVLMSISQIIFTSAFNITNKTGVLMMLTLFTLVPSYFVSIITYGEEINVICLLGLGLLGWGLWRTMFYGEEIKH